MFSQHFNPPKEQQQHPDHPDKLLELPPISTSHDPSSRNSPGVSLPSIIDSTSSSSTTSRSLSSQSNSKSDDCTVVSPSLVEKNHQSHDQLPSPAATTDDSNKPASSDNSSDITSVTASSAPPSPPPDALTPLPTLVTPQNHKLIHKQQRQKRPQAASTTPKSTSSAPKKQQQKLPSSPSANPVVTPTEKIKKYKCCYCDRAFSRSEHRSRHERSHTKERPFHCPKCPSTFVRRDLLLRHDRTVHAKTQKPPSSASSTATTTTKAKASKASTKASKAAPAPTCDISSKAEMPSSPPALNPPPSLSISMPSPQSPVAELRQPRKPTTKQIKKEPKSTVSTPTTAAVTKKKKNSDLQNLLNDTPAQITPKLQPISAISSSSTSNNTLPSIASKLSSSLNALATAASEDSLKRPREVIEKEDEFNAALLMTELHHSLQASRQQQQQQQQQEQPYQPPPQKRRQHHSPSPHQDQLNAPSNLADSPSPPRFSSHPPPVRASPPQSYAPSSQYLRTPQLSHSFLYDHLLKYFDADKKHPTKLQLNRYLASYFLYFHPTLPFLHPHTFDPSTVAPPLLFGVCSIGALLCREKPMAVLLHNTSRTLISSILEVSKDYPQKASSPLWTVQTLITALIYQFWTGDLRGLEFVSSIRATITSFIKHALTEKLSRQHHQSWSDFIETELVIRAFFSIYILFGSLTMLYNYPLQIEEVPPNTPLPCSEVFWNSADSMFTHPFGIPQSPRFHQVLEAMSQSAEATTARFGCLSPLALRALGTTLFKRSWRLTNSSPVVDDAKRDELLAIIDTWETIAVDANPGQGQALTQFWLSSPSLVLAMAVEDGEPTPIRSNSISSNGQQMTLMQRIRSQQHPLLFDAHVQALVSQARLLVPMPLVHASIRFHVPHDISSAALASLHAFAKRSDPQLEASLTRLVGKCFELFKLAKISGVTLLETCPEVLLSFFELCLVLVFWCFRHEQAEAAVGSPGTATLRRDPLYAELDRFCTEVGMEREDGRWASAIALAGSEMLEKCSTWGVAAMLALSLRAFGFQLMSTQEASPTTAAAVPGGLGAMTMPSPPERILNQPLVSNLRTTSEKGYIYM